MFMVSSRLWQQQICTVYLLDSMRAVIGQFCRLCYIVWPPEVGCMSLRDIINILLTLFSQSVL